MSSYKKVHEAYKIRRLKHGIFRTNSLQDRDNIFERQDRERPVILGHPPNLFYAGKSCFNLFFFRKRYKRKNSILRSVALCILSDYLEKFCEFEQVKGVLWDQRFLPFRILSHSPAGCP